MIGPVGEMHIQADSLIRRIKGNPRVEKSLEEVELAYIGTLLASYIGRGADLRNWLVGAQINRDRSLRLQYLAGLAIDESHGVDICRAVATLRRFPEEMITAPRRLVSRIEALWN